MSVVAGTRVQTIPVLVIAGLLFQFVLSVKQRNYRYVTSSIKTQYLMLRLLCWLLWKRDLGEIWLLLYLRGGNCAILHITITITEPCFGPMFLPPGVTLLHLCNRRSANFGNSRMEHEFCR